MYHNPIPICTSLSVMIYYIALYELHFKTLNQKSWALSTATQSAFPTKKLFAVSLWSLPSERNKMETKKLCWIVGSQKLSGECVVVVKLEFLKISYCARMRMFVLGRLTSCKYHLFILFDLLYIFLSIDEFVLWRNEWQYFIRFAGGTIHLNATSVALFSVVFVRTRSM